MLMRWNVKACSYRGCRLQMRARQSDLERIHVEDIATREAKWQQGCALQADLKECVLREDFDAAARLRDQISSLEFSPMQQLEMQQVSKLQDGTYDEKMTSLQVLGQLYPTAKTQALIVDCIQDERLTVLAQHVIQAVWLRHPTNMHINMLMESGLKGMAMLVVSSSALEKFEEAAQLDPNFPEAWNKIATVQYLQNEYLSSIESCEKAICLNPQHYLALSGKGLCHMKLGEKEEAYDCWRAALEINPFLTQLRRYMSASERGDSGN